MIDQKPMPIAFDLFHLMYSDMLFVILLKLLLIQNLNVTIFNFLFMALVQMFLY